LLYNLLVKWSKYVGILKMDRRRMDTYKMMEKDANELFEKGHK